MWIWKEAFNNDIVKWYLKQKCVIISILKCRGNHETCLKTAIYYLSELISTNFGSLKIFILLYKIHFLTWLKQV